MLAVPRATHVACIAFLVATGCQVEAESEESLGSTHQNIVGGVDNTGDLSVVMLGLGGSICTGTLVRTNVVLTAAHCVDTLIESNQTNRGSVFFGQGSKGSPRWIHQIRIIDMAMHRQFAGFIEKDIALVRLAEDAPPQFVPIPFNTQPIGEDWVDTEVRTVGFGNNDGENGTGSGTKRQTIFRVAGVTGEHVRVGNEFKNTCQGDSGGPTLAMIDGVETVIAVTSFGPAGCTGVSSLARTDVYLDDFLLETLEAWNGPCAQDGECATDCQFIDPDCDICGFNNQCGEECATVDLDCPLVGLAGDYCEDEFDCESRLCIEAPDDSRVKYCSQSCTEGSNVLEQCDAPLTACRSGVSGEPVCLFGGATPGTQGATCRSGGDCLSGLCDSGPEICVEPCSSDADCGGEFSCNSVGGEKVCTLGGGGGCSAGGSSPLPLAGLFLVLGLAFVTRRRPLRA